MWKIMICDDEAECRGALLEMLARYEQDSGEKLSVATAESGEELLETVSPSCDLLLLDIQMKTLSGMSAARTLRQKGLETPIIFITAMTEYAMEGYEVHAFGFLKKPVHYRQLAWQLDELFSFLKKKHGVPLVVQDGDVIRSYRSSEIVWAEVLGHEVILHLVNGGTQRCTTPLAQLEKQLCPVGFFRIHKSFLINLQFVRSIHQTTVCMTEGSEVPLSKHRRQDFLFSFAEYQGLS